MARITTEDYELLGFFEVEPTLRDENTDWLNTESTYVVSRKDTTISFSVHPSYRDVRIEVKNHGEITYELFAMGVGNVSLTRTESLEYLTILLDGDHSIDLYLKPNIRVKQQIEVQT